MKKLPKGISLRQFHLEAKRLAMHVMRATFPDLVQHPSLFTVLAFDYIVDDNRQVYLADITEDFTFSHSGVDSSVFTEFVALILDIETAALYEAWDVLDSIVARTEFDWIFDGRKEGSGRYAQGLISDDCI
jgi:hypothetical protein